VPLDQQRAEHMEMWMFLDDPAMPLAPPPPEMEVEAVVEGASLKVTASVPVENAGQTFRITLERHPAAVPDNLPAVPENGPDRQRASRERRRAASALSFAFAETKPASNTLTATIPIPPNAPAKPWTVRVFSKRDIAVGGVAEIH